MNYRLGIGLALTILLSFGMLALSFDQQIWKPNDYLFSTGGDGVKNYFTPLYYLHHDDGIWFDGMLYPYGEHVVFTDNQPIISWALSFVDDHVLPIKENALGILNLLMLVSQVLTCIFVFMILRKFQVKLGLAVIFSILIGLMAPQLERIIGHYALSYSFFIPLIWYFLLEYLDRKILWPLIVVAAITTLFTFVHVYYLALSLAFSSTYLLFAAIYGRITWYKLFLNVLIIIIPLLIFKLFLTLTDPILDRPDTPFGYFSFRSDITSVFLPNEGPVFEYLKENFGLKNKGWEGFAYVGIPTTLVALFSIICLILYWIRRSDFNMPIFSISSNLKISLWAGSIIFLFSMAFPFRLGLDFVWENLGPLKQLRSIGRFAWVFYFVMTIFAATIIDRMFKFFVDKKLPLVSYLGIGIICLIWIAECSEYLNRMSSRIEDNEQVKGISQPGNYKSDIEGTLNIQFEDYRAILGLPFYLGGTERFFVEMNHNSSVKFMEISLAGGLPLINSSLSRTSFSNAFLVAQVVNHEILPKGALRDFPNNSPILVVVDNAPLSNNERSILVNAKFLGKFNELDVYSIKPDRMKRQVVQCSQYENAKDTGKYYDHSLFTRSGNTKLDAVDWEIIHESIVHENEVELEYSIWVDLMRMGNRTPQFKGALLDRNGEVVWSEIKRAIFVKDLFNYWSRIEFEIPGLSDSYKLQISTTAPKELIGSRLLRSLQDTIVTMAGTDTCLINNYPNWKEHKYEE